MNRILNYPALAELKSAVAALNPSSSFTAIQTQFQLVDAALSRAKQEQAIAHNQSIPIGSLPHEIISHIFELHRDSHRTSEWSDVIAPSICVSRVSATWRHIALSMSALWTIFTSCFNYSNSFYDAMINRSRESSLEFKIRVESPNDLSSANRLLSLIPPNSYRMSTLVVEGPTALLDNLVPALRELSAPRMTHLSLTRLPRGPLRSQHSICQYIFTGGAPNLLVFDARSFDMRAVPPMASIQVLRLVCNNATSSIAFGHALHEASLTVRTLDLIIRPAALQAHSSIYIPCFTQLELMADTRELATALRIIQAPLLDTLLLHFPVPKPTESHFHGFDSIAGKYSKLLYLKLGGFLGSGIIIAFPTIEALIVSDSGERTTHPGGIFDPNQDGFTTLTPCLALIAAPMRFRADIEAFQAPRESLGLSVPQFIAIEDWKKIRAATE